MKKILITLVVILFIGCNSDEEFVDFSEENDLEIQSYLTENNITAQKSVSGLYYTIDNLGTGEHPTIADRVKVAYKGYFTDGTTFDESNEGISFNLQNVIQGWAEGITYFKEGGSGQLFIPAHLAYGSSGTTGIPGGSVLVFDIELIYVNYETENEEEITAYLTNNDLEAIKSDSGLYYIIDEQGEGDQPNLTDNVTVSYKGYFTDGVIFDNGSESINFDLGGLIAGFSEGITYFKEGGSGQLLIPAHLAYGNNGTTGIPGGSVLIFDIGLISIN